MTSYKKGATKKGAKASQAPTWWMGSCLFVYFGCLLTSFGFIIAAISTNWYQFEDEHPKGLYWETCPDDDAEICPKTLHGSEYTLLAFISLGVLPAFGAIISSVVLFWRCCTCLNGRDLVQLQIYFMFATSFIWFMALASFFILTPQRLALRGHESYDRSLRNSTYLVIFGDGFYYLLVSFILSFIAMVASSFLQVLADQQFVNLPV